MCHQCVAAEKRAEQEAAVERLTDKVMTHLRGSLVFDKVERVGPTTLAVSIWNFDPAAQEGFTIECKLGVSL